MERHSVVCVCVCVHVCVRVRVSACMRVYEIVTLVFSQQDTGMHFQLTSLKAQGHRTVKEESEKTLIWAFSRIIDQPLSPKLEQG